MVVVIQKLLMINRQDKLRGVLFGLAAGDRIGGPLRMAMQLSESLISQKRFDINHIGAAYLKWWNNEGFDTGPVAGEVFDLVNTGLSFLEAASIVDLDANGMTAGCNPTHRSVVLALASFISDEQLVQYAKQEAALTHKHPLAGDVAAAAVVLCRTLINGMDWESAVIKAAEGRILQTEEALVLSPLSPSNKDGFAPDVLKAAIYFVHNSSNFSEALHNSIQFAGPSNYCPVLVGSIGGAKWGSSEILGNDLKHCSSFSRVAHAATLLLNM